MNFNPNQLFDWSKFLQSFTGEESIFSASNNNDKVEAYMEQVGEKIQSMVTKSFPMSAQPAQKAKVFETHKSVFVRWKVPKKVDPFKIRIHVNNQRVRLSNIANHKNFSIQLPSQVTTRGCHAKIHKGILEIRLPKSLKRLKEKEIFIYDL
ncbi:Hsp20/alpha crystallin family protein [Paenibacillus sepulcri]|uniref:Hsp20/alpha crystallin family protein n=1 Tax=Paenibacillus sepulcri TaxID=359917 RepID=A0ABS7C4D1_9BACL|nr:Hsp20/alpha crystallin family protein [Paenibacillus sepulcri]